MRCVTRVSERVTPPHQLQSLRRQRERFGSRGDAACPANKEHFASQQSGGDRGCVEIVVGADARC